VPDPRTVLSRPAPPPDVTTPYGDLPEQVIDVRLPAGDSGRPPVTFLHGGFWRAEWDRAHAGPLAAALALAGWPVAVVEYRRVGHAGGGWPGTFCDVEAAVEAAPALVDRVLAGQGRPPAPAGAVLVGHSAGGQLALWYAGTTATRLRGVLALAPVADLAEAYALDLDAGAVAALLGGGPADVPERYAAADPVAHPPLVPAVVLHGDRDAQVPLRLSRRYAATAVAAGADVTLRVLPGTEHFGLIDPLSTAWPAVTAGLQTFTIDAG
jgi:acetyl esterase/lipase